jgi:hypothetical protein
MKKNLRTVIIIAALNLVLGATSGVLAQQVPIVGGYAETSSTNAEVVAAARFAVRAERRKEHTYITLLSIERAEQQVVAGMNYRLRLKVKVHNQTQDVTTVVYKNLRQRYSLTSWDVADNHARSSSAVSNSSIAQLEQALADAYMAKELGKLDAKHPYFGRVKIVIEHSLAGDTDKDIFEIKSFTTLAKGERWLKSREQDDGTPFREVRSLLQCEKGVCTYDLDGGIDHNHLYLTKIAYAYRNGRPLIKTIFFLDGD